MILVTAATGMGPYKWGNNMASGSPATPGSQRTGAPKSSGVRYSSTKSVRPENNLLAGRCTCSGVERWMKPMSSNDSGRYSASDEATVHSSAAHRCTSTAGSLFTPSACRTETDSA